MTKAKQSLSAAELLCEQEFYQFSVSRACYSVFNVAQTLLASIRQSYPVMDA